MRAIGWVCAGVVLGFVLGGIGPRWETQRLERSLAEAREEGGAGGGDAQRPMFRSPIPGFDQALQAPAADDDDAEAEEGFEFDEAPPRRHRRRGWWRRGRRGHYDAGVGTSGDGEPEGAEGSEESFEMVAAAQRIRAAQSRAALREQASLSEEQMSELDRIVEDMNGRLLEYANELIVLTVGDGEVEAAEFLGMSHDVTGILYEAQQDVDRLVAEGGEEVEPEATEVWNYVDLERFVPAVEEMSRER